MSAQKLLVQLPVPLQNLAISLYGIGVRSSRYGGEFRRFRMDLDAHDSLSKEQLAQHESRSLQAMLEWAQERVPHYREALASHRGFAGVTAANLPALLGVLEKDFVREHARQFHADLKGEKSRTIFTSGTSGSPLVVQVDLPALQKNYAFYARTLAWFGVQPTDRHATFAGRVFMADGATGGPYWRRNLAMNQKLFSSYHISADTLPAYLDELQRWHPVYIDSYPSAIHLLASEMNRQPQRWHIRPRAILVSSETLLMSQREQIETAFRCPVVDQYGNAEMAAWLNQCERGSLHINSDYGIVEVLNEAGQSAAPGETGEMVCTGFVNRGMPLIRYRVGDSAILAGSSCACGRPYPVVEQIVGRIDGMVITPSGRQIGRLDPVFKGVEHIAEAQLVQTESDLLVAKVVPDAHFSDADGAKLLTQIRQRLGDDMRVQLQRVETIGRTRAGKFQAVVSLAQHRKSMQASS